MLSAHNSQLTDIASGVQRTTQLLSRLSLSPSSDSETPASPILTICSGPELVIFPPDSYSGDPARCTVFISQ